MEYETLDSPTIFKFFINFFADELFSEYKLYRLIFMLVMTTKGLTKVEAMEIADIQEI